MVCFELGGDRFAFSMGYLVEIVQVQIADITPFVSPIPLIRGKWNYRGTTVYIIDIREFFGIEENKSDREHGHASERSTQTPAEKAHTTQNVLVVKLRERIFGIVADATFQVVSLTSFYEYPNLLSTLPNRYFAGVTTIDSKLVILLAIEEFLQEYEIEALLSEIGEKTTLSHRFTA